MDTRQNQEFSLLSSRLKQNKGAFGTSVSSRAAQMWSTSADSGERLLRTQTSAEQQDASFAIVLQSKWSVSVFTARLDTDALLKTTSQTMRDIMAVASLELRLIVST